MSTESNQLSSMMCQIQSFPNEQCYSKNQGSCALRPLHSSTVQEGGRVRTIHEKKILAAEDVRKDLDEEC